MKGISYKFRDPIYPRKNQIGKDEFRQGQLNFLDWQGQLTHVTFYAYRLCTRQGCFVPGKDGINESEHAQLLSTTWRPQCHQFCYLSSTVSARSNGILRRT